MAIKVGVGISRKKNAALAAREALRWAQLDIAESQVDLAIVFNSIELSSPELLTTLAAYLGDVPIIGCSSSAVISRDGIHKCGLAIMLLRFFQGAYCSTASIQGASGKTAHAAGLELGEKLLYGFKNVRRDFSVIFSGGIQDNAGLIAGLQERLGKSFTIFGGCASGNADFAKTLVYSNKESLSDTASGILLGGRLNCAVGIKHGWKPLGKPRRVTKSNGNIVFEIDSKPAADIYRDYLISDLDKIKKELNRISILYPIGISIPGEDEYLLRSLIDIREDGSLLLQGDIPQGSRIRLMIGTKESWLAAARRAASEVKSGLMGRPINFVLVLSSVSRYIVLGRQAEDEIKAIREELEGSPKIIGLYTLGEWAPSKAIDYQGLTRLHNQTIAILGVSA